MWSIKIHQDIHSDIPMWPTALPLTTIGLLWKRDKNTAIAEIQHLQLDGGKLSDRLVKL